eukprot:scaffold2113_cov63-Attheya_sp.AAC.15
MTTGPSKRTDLNGTWRLDKQRGNPSMQGYLETMGVPPLAIEVGYALLYSFLVSRRLVTAFGSTHTMWLCILIC